MKEKRGGGGPCSFSSFTTQKRKKRDKSPFRVEKKGEKEGGGRKAIITTIPLPYFCQEWNEEDRTSGKEK